MKANRKFVEEREAVSAVIGVILMVAITVAIAATVFVYVNQLADTGGGSPKTVAAQYESQETGTGNAYVVMKVTSADAGIPWDEVSAKWINGTCPTINNSDNSAAMTGNIAVGDYFSVNLGHDGTYDIDLMYDGKIIWSCPTISLPS